MKFLKKTRFDSKSYFNIYLGFNKFTAMPILCMCNMCRFHPQSFTHAPNP